MSEYAKSKDYGKLVGKRARIKTNLPDYSSFLYGQKGTIQAICGNLFLKFDKPAKRSEDDWNPMSGVYLTETSFILIGSKKSKSKKKRGKR